MLYFLKQKYLTIVSKEIIAWILFFTPFISIAQVFYSTDPDYLKGKTEQNNLLSSYKNLYPDTNLLEFSNYFPRNFMGNMGLSSPDYLFSYGTQDIGFRYFKPPTDNDRFDVNQVRYYRSKGPYADLTGIAGTKRYEIFKLLFTHTYRDKINITVGFNRYTSKGFYKQQQTYTNNFYLTSNYTTAKKRSGYYLYILNNGNKNQENGGIKDGQLTDSSLKLNKELFSVNLSNASRENREQKFMFNPWLKLNSKADSISNYNHYLQLKASLVNSSYKYYELGTNTDDFYKESYYDSLQSNDSSHVRKYLNDISYSMLKSSETMALSFGYLNEINQIWQRTGTSFMNQIVHTEWSFNKDLSSKDSLKNNTRHLETKLAANYVFEGVNQGNYKVESNSEFNVKNNRNKKIFIDFLFEKRNADYMQNNWQSNHFMWANKGFKAIQQLQTKIGFKIKAIQFWVFGQSLNNYIYFDKEALPQQSKKAITNLGINLNFSKIFFKHLGFSLNYLFQNTSEPSIVRIPQHHGTAKLFYNGILANNNLQLQIGAQLNVYDSFTAYSYMPATQIYYLQDNFKTSAYPFLDLYMNVRIRPVSFFVKVENALFGFAGPDFSFVPGYYQTDRAFRFGINWMFFD